ncbi:hypothetical protein QR680_014747 [Steinernema hermaphroditum]|uniref:Uncharacterized protein n=1 Tax=Steinernema hermaphroditum TaxID=289476 RepID=A0AA39M4F9_9BILA|nr:hypothetical protein QR680_014747 [Steinernema hermaphroditum]
MNCFENENIVSVSAENLPIRAKRYEYHVSMPFSSVRIKGTNPLIEEDGIDTAQQLIFALLYLYILVKQ